MTETRSAQGNERKAVRTEHRELTRRRLTEAAGTAFRERGYAGTSVDHIARSAGISRATFYLHFTSKAELIAEIWAIVRVRLLELHRSLAAEPFLNEEVLANWLDETFDFYAEHRNELLAIHEAIALEAEMAKRYRERMSEVSDVIDPLIMRSRGVDAPHARLRSSLLTMQLERFCHFWILRGMPFDRDAARETMAQLWFEQLGYVGDSSAGEGISMTSGSALDNVRVPDHN